MRGSKVNRTSKYQSLKIKTRTDNPSMQIATVLAIRVEAEESLATVRSSPRKGPPLTFSQQGVANVFLLPPSDPH